MEKEKKPSVELSELDDLRHSIGNARIKLHKIELHLREWHRTKNTQAEPETIYRVIDELVNYNCDVLLPLWDEVNKLIEKT